MSQAVAKARDASFDILKGIGILAVIALHATSFSTRNYTTVASPEWWLLNAINRFLALGVPTFLLVSAVLLARSAAKRTDWKRFYLRRAESVLWPFLVWTVLYWLFRFFVLRNPADVDVITRHSPFGELHGPALWVNLHNRGRDVLLGKAYFHLYFLSILLQFVIAFPLFVISIRRLKIGFGWVCLLSIVLQAVIFWFQREILRFSYPGTLFAWYFVVFIPGVWIGLHWSEWPGVWRKWRFPIAIAFVATFLWFMMRAMQTILGLPIDGYEMNECEKLFTMVSALALLGASTAWTDATSIVARCLQALGKSSLQLYLVHPMILFYLSGPRIGGAIDRVPASPLVLIVLLVTISYAFALVCSFTGLERPLFGRAGDPIVPPFWEVLRTRGEGVRR